MDNTNDFRAALRFQRLAPCYDAILHWTMRDRQWKARLIESASIAPNHRVLDFGCGTGTLALLLKARLPTADVVGLDIDPRMIELARRKAVSADSVVQWVVGRLSDGSMPSETFDRVVTSLVFHHLRHEEKVAALRAVNDLLIPGGGLFIADYGQPHDWLMRAAFLMVQVLDGFDRTRANVRGELPRLLCEAGFVDVGESYRTRTISGTVCIYQAWKPNRERS